MNQTERNELARLLAEATPGEWVPQQVLSDRGRTQMEIVTDAFDVVSAHQGIRREADTLLIAAMKNALPQLLADSAELERLRGVAKTETVEPPMRWLDWDARAGCVRIHSGRHILARYDASDAEGTPSGDDVFAYQYWQESGVTREVFDLAAALYTMITRDE